MGEVMTAHHVQAVLDALSQSGLRVWVDGGWGLDALLGEQTREHEDLDIVAEMATLDSLVTTVGRLGYAIAEDHLPTRLVLRAGDRRQVDVHPVTFDQSGTGWQVGAGPDGSDCPYPADGFTVGRIGGREVGCLSAALQVSHHTGYEPSEIDRHDMRLLSERLEVPLPPPY